METVLIIAFVLFEKVNASTVGHPLAGTVRPLELDVRCSAARFRRTCTRTN
jgi:hypothetical protein